jgi:hypothetical protein
LADVRTLKLNLLADVSDFGRGINAADADTNKLESNLKRNGRKMAKSIGAVTLAVGALAIALGVDAVKAAAEDERSSRILEEQLRKTVGANDEMVASVEAYISKTQLRVGIQDDQLRPSFARLLRSTEDVDEAQKALNLALDISVATGKDLEPVTAALGKAYDGNDASLGRLGLGLDAAILKSGDTNLIMETLTKTFGGFADKESKTFEGQLRIVNIRLDETKEAIGTKLLPVMGTLLTTVNDVAKGFSGEDPEGLSNRARELAGNFEGNGANSLGGSLRAVADAFKALFEEITSGDAANGASTLERLASAMETFAAAIESITKAYEGYMKFYDKVPEPLKDFMNPFKRLGGYVRAVGSRAAGGPVMGDGAYRVGEFGPELFVPNGQSGSIRPDNGAGGGVTIIMNGVIDGESARRSIERLLQDSSKRTGAVNLVGATL